MRKIPFEDGIYYHIYNRGMDKGRLFFNEDDYLRFICSIFYFNDSNFIPGNFPHRERYHPVQGLALDRNPNRKELIDLLAWCLIPNHYHFIIKQKLDGGITKFMQRLGTGYTMFFNLKHEKSGHIFQGTFKAKPIEDNEYLQHLTRYIHLNPLEIFEPKWKENGVKDIESSKKFILKYRWSSLNDYLNPENQSLLTSKSYKDFLFTNIPTEYKKFLWEWLENGVPEDFSILSKA